MTQDVKWMARYEEVISLIEANHRNPIPEQVLASFQWQATRSSAPTRSLSRHRIEEHDMLNWVKQQRNLIKVGTFKPDRMKKFEKLEKLFENNKRLSQWV